MMERKRIGVIPKGTKAENLKIGGLVAAVVVSLAIGKEEPIMNLVDTVGNGYQARDSVMVLDDVMNNCYANASRAGHLESDLSSIAALGQIREDLRTKKWDYNSIDWPSLSTSKSAYCPIVEEKYIEAGIANGQPWGM